MTTTLSERGLGNLTDLVREIRPEWDTAGCVAALRKIRDLPADQLIIASVRYATDPNNLTPAHLADLGNRAWDSDWHLPCRQHPGNRAWRTNGECASCYADRTGVTSQPIHDRGGKPPTPETREQILTAIRAPITGTPRRHRAKPSNEVMAKARAELEQVRAAHATAEPTEAAE